MTYPLARWLLKAVLPGFVCLAAFLGLAIATGLFSIVVTSGVSMNPVYYQGDLVVVARADSYQVGEIVAYNVPGKDFVALHRIIGGDATNGFVFKGDNNQSSDPTHPTPDQLVGHAVLHLPGVGKWLKAITSPFALAVFAFALTLVGGTTIHTRRRRKRAAMASQTPRRTVSVHAVRALPERLQIALGVTGVVALLGAALAVAAWTTSPEQLANSSSQASRQLTFSYTAQVPPSPAYDGTTVRSPDPVFRKLTNTVDVHLDYQGPPGTMSVAAELTTPSGWHSTVPLGTGVAVSGGGSDKTATLDLNSLDALAASAAAVTGLPASPLSVDVKATVQSEGAEDFTPTLTLDLEELKLSMAGNPTVSGSIIVPDSTLVANAVGFGPVHIGVPAARVLSALLLLLAAGVAAAVAVIGRRMPPVSEVSAIRRRYAPLLASVAPMTARPDLPVVDVDEFASLAKMAQRCGQLVLNWSRSEIETFVVLDEGITYRYRIGSVAPAEAVTPDGADGVLIDEAGLPAIESR